MKQFIIKIALFSLFFFVLEKAFLPLRNSAPELEVGRRLESIITGKIDAEVLIYGSSRGARSVIASQLADSIGHTCYNLSYPGSDIGFHTYLLRETLETPGNTIPKVVVLVVDDANEFKEAKMLGFRFDRMYPLVKYKTIRDEMVKQREKKWLVNELLITHQLNKSHFLMKQQAFTKNDSIMKCGSMPISHQKKNFEKLYKYKHKPYIYSRDGEYIQKLRAFDEFVQLCKKHKIKLVIAIPPNFRKVTTGFQQRLEELIGGYGTVFAFDPSIPEYADQAYFFDNAHLQKNGASIFTDELTDVIGRYF